MGSQVLVAVRVTALSGSLLGSSSLSILHSQDNNVEASVASRAPLSLPQSDSGVHCVEGRGRSVCDLPQEASHSPPQEFSALLYSLLQDTEAAQPAEGLH